MKITDTEGRLPMRWDASTGNKHPVYFVNFSLGDTFVVEVEYGHATLIACSKEEASGYVAHFYSKEIHWEQIPVTDLPLYISLSYKSMLFEEILKGGCCEA